MSSCHWWQFSVHSWRVQWRGNEHRFYAKKYYGLCHLTIILLQHTCWTSGPGGADFRTWFVAGTPWCAGSLQTGRGTGVCWSPAVTASRVSNMVNSSHIFLFEWNQHLFQARLHLDQWRNVPGSWVLRSPNWGMVFRSSLPPHPSRARYQYPIWELVFIHRRVRAGTRCWLHLHCS